MATETKRASSFQPQITGTMSELPWWLLVIMLAGLFLVYSFYTDATYIEIFNFIKVGIITTLQVTLIAYAISITVGLLAGLGRHARAMMTIGVHYEKARSVTKDLVQAHLWYNLAAAYGERDGAKWRDRLVLDMTRDQIAQAQFLARNWRPKAQVQNQEEQPKLLPPEP